VDIKGKNDPKPPKGLVYWRKENGKSSLIKENARGDPLTTPGVQWLVKGGVRGKGIFSQKSRISRGAGIFT